MEQEHFSKAPITEAIIDIRLTPHTDMTADSLASIMPSIAEHYPQKQDVFADQFSFGVSGQAQVETSRQQIGSRYPSIDNREILFVRLDGFTFSVLRPYDTWESFRDEARRLWNIYRANVSLKAISRIAVRYINRIDIPKVTIAPRDYLRTFPEISSDAPSQIINYFMQLQLLVPELKGIALINQTIVPPPQEGMVSLVLDIDLYREEEPPQEDEDIWAFFEQLRFHKNSIFKACITERTKELIR